MNAMEVYKSLSQPPATALRQITAGNLKGKTDINPQWRYEIMTKTFGLVGIGWKYEIQKVWTEQGAKGEVLAFAQVAVFIRNPDTKDWSDPIVGIGGSKLVNAFSAGLQSNDEGYKMAVTDAFSTSLKMLGVAADIYAGKWDGIKYKECVNSGNAKQNATANSSANASGQSLKGGADTQEEHSKINELLETKKADGSPVFSPEEIKQVGAWRKERTAQQVIGYLSDLAAQRNAVTEEPFPEDIPF